MTPELPTSPDWRSAWRKAVESCRFTDAALTALAEECERDLTCRVPRLSVAPCSPVFPGRGPELRSEKYDFYLGVFLNDNVPWEAVCPLTFAMLEGERATVEQAERAYLKAFYRLPEPWRSAWFRHQENAPRAKFLGELAKLCRMIVAEHNPVETEEAA